MPIPLNLRAEAMRRKTHLHDRGLVFDYNGEEVIIYENCVYIDNRLRKAFSHFPTMLEIAPLVAEHKRLKKQGRRRGKLKRRRRK